MAAKNSGTRLSIVVAGIIFALCLMLYLSYHFCVNISENENVLYWITLASGNWSPSSRPTGANGIGDFTFAVSAFGAVILNIGNFLGIGTALALIWRISNRLGNIQESLMKLNDILPARDLSIKMRILDLFPEDKAEEIGSLLDKGFSEGSEVWNRVHLPKIFGEKTAKRYHEVLDSQLIPQ